MAYALKYRCEFSSYKGVQYRFEIEQKNYSGSFFTLQASGNPITQNWATDDPKPAIKGCAIKFEYLNKGTQPLNIFYSEEDDTFKGTLTNLTTNEVLFVGYLIQDDSAEIEVGQTHAVVLSFNDNLGLLKDVNLQEAFNQYIFPDLLVGKQSLATVLFACLQATNIALPIRIYSNIYEVTQVKTTSTFQTTLIDTDTFLKDDSNYESCYTVLEKILKPIEATLLQSNGYWHVVRWSELRYYNNAAITYFEWDKDFNQLGQGQLSATAFFGATENIKSEFGLTKRILRPLKSVKETFNYKQPNGLIKNISLKNLGALISDTVSGNIRTRIYQLPANSLWRKLNGDTSRIAIETDIVLNIEVQRYVIQPFTGYAPIEGLRPCFTFNEIEVAKDDIIDLSFMFKGNPSGGNTKRFSIIVNVQRLTSAGTNTSTNPSYATWIRSNNVDPTTNIWGWNRRTELYSTNEPRGNAYSIPNEDNLTEWQPFSLSDMISRTTRNGDENLEFPKIPFDGLLKIYIIGWNTAGNDNNRTGFIKDFKFNLKYRVNDNTNVIGQTHLDAQNGIIKNVEDNTIEIDDSPRNSISGTLFIPQKTSVLYTKTKTWQHENGFQQGMLARLIVFDRLFQRRIPRTILEGSFFGLIFDNNKTISALSVLASANYNGLFFVIGNLEINYRQDSFTGTYYELQKQGETDSDLIEDYNFNYLYENK